MSETNDDGVFPIEDSLCNDCALRCTRVFIPIDYSAYGISLDDFDLEDGEPLEVEQHTCLALNQDLDCIVLQCNHFKDINTTGLINNFVF